MSTIDTIHVLHVDDDLDFVEMAATLLEREDERLIVTTASTASEGLDHLAKNDVSCVVSDHDMHGKSGVEFLKSVRETYPDLPYILYTGKGSEQVASDAISAGVTDYLQKKGGTDQYVILANRVVNAAERYRIEQEVERTEAQLQAISENSADAIVMIDSDSRIRFTNPAVEDYFGYTGAELRDEPLTKIMPERYREAHQTAVDRYIETDERSLNWLNVEFRGQHRDGTEIPLSVSVSEFQQDGEQRFLGILRDISERTQLEAELREREERFRQLAENINDVVWMTDSEKEELFYVNPAYESIWGQSVESLYETPTRFLDAIYPEDRERVEAALDLQPAGEYDIEYRIIRPDGELRWIRDQAISVRDDDGDVYRIVGIASDITERKEQTRQLETLISNLPGMVYRCRNEPDWPMEIVRGECEELTGYPAAELEHGDVVWGDEIVHPQDQHRKWESVQESLDDGQPIEDTYRIRTKDGATKWIWERARVVGSGHNEAARLEGFITDVTERKKRERQLEEKTEELEQLATRFEAQYRTLFEEAPVMAVITRVEDGRPIIEDCNSQFIEMIGYDKGAIIGNELAEFYTPESAETLLRGGGYRRSLDGKFTREKRDLLTANGEVIETILRAVPRRADEGDIIGTVAMYIDITEREAVKRANERLEEFTSVVSHDLRNPLSVAISRLELAAEECNSEHLGHVEQAHDRMGALIDDLLTLAREGKEVTDPRSVDLAEMIDACWETVETSEASLITDIDRSVRADRSRLRQVFENLFRNSVEHGGADVTVTVGELDDGFYVEDDGPGIPDDERNDVFEAGYSRSAEGTGFGLSIVEQVVNAHDWQIRVTEGSEGGARFEITGLGFVAG